MRGVAAIAADAATMALGLMKEELKNEEIERRIEAMRRIGVVAKVIGPEQARTTLLDLLRESVEDDDEVLLAMAKSLAELVDAIGGPEHAGLLLPLLASSYFWLASSAVSS